MIFWSNDPDHLPAPGSKNTGFDQENYLFSKIEVRSWFLSIFLVLILCVDYSIDIILHGSSGEVAVNASVVGVAEVKIMFFHIISLIFLVWLEENF